MWCGTRDHGFNLFEFSPLGNILRRVKKIKILSKHIYSSLKSLNEREVLKKLWGDLYNRAKLDLGSTNLFLWL